MGRPCRALSSVHHLQDGLPPDLVTGIALEVDRSRGGSSPSDRAALSRGTLDISEALFQARDRALHPGGFIEAELISDLASARQCPSAAPYP